MESQITSGNNKIDRNLSCVNAFLQVLASVPEISKMFQKPLGIQNCDKMTVCQEISQLFRANRKTNASPPNLRNLIELSTAVEKLNFSDYFRKVYSVIQKELRHCQKENQDTWAKFQKPVSDKNNSVNILKLDVPEGVDTVLTRLMNAKLLKDCSLTQLPDFLLVELNRKDYSYDAKVFPENRMKLINGQTFELRCIIDYIDDKYVLAVIMNGIWVICKDTKLIPATKDEVKTVHNQFFFYEKIPKSSKTFTCDVSGCPVDKPFESIQSLTKHKKEEHPKCKICGETFLMKCLFKEHLDECRDSGHESLSDSTVEEENKQKKVREEQMVIHDKRKKTRKRKMKDWDSEFQKVFKKHKINNETTLSDFNYVCESQETDPFEEDERYRSPSGSKEKNSIMSCGLIIRNQSIIDGIPKFVSFNNKFLHKLGCQFYFKDTGRVVKIFSYSKKGDKLQYKLILESKKSGKSSKVKAVVGEKINIAAYDFDSDVIEYKLIVNMS